MEYDFFNAKNELRQMWMNYLIDSKDVLNMEYILMKLLTANQGA